MMWYLTRCSSEPILLRVSDVVNYILVVVMHNQMQGFSKQSSEEKKLHFCFNNNVYTCYVIISLDYWTII
jgi:hypothetical protein